VGGGRGREKECNQIFPCILTWEVSALEGKGGDLLVGISGHGERERFPEGKDVRVTLSKRRRRRLRRRLDGKGKKGKPFVRMS